MDEEEETVTLGFGTLPERVTPGTQSTAILTLTDNDDRGVTVSPTKLEVTEGGSDTYTVVLRSEPTDDVTVAVNVPEGAEFTAAEGEADVHEHQLGRDADGDGEGGAGRRRGGGDAGADRARRDRGRLRGRGG